ncbi:CAZyme family GH128 [Paecilomyces variotii]|nr:CAZyme family GH128 [Paecilomyces variotii]
MVSFSALFVSGLMATVALAAPHQAHQHLHAKRNATSAKKGAAYNEASLLAALTGVSWAYNWNMEPDGTLPPGVEYVPMLWGPKMYSGWSAAADSALSSGSKYLLGFNEPDVASQANMSPSQAASDYKQYMTPYAGNATLVSPAVSNSGSAGQGLDWMKSFLSECTDCQISALAVHWYADASLTDYFKQFVNQAIELANQNNIQEVWITEFQATGDDASQVQFLTEILPWLDSQAGVGRYSYFMCSNSVLLTAANVLSQIGQAYMSLF